MLPLLKRHSMPCAPSIANAIGLWHSLAHVIVLPWYFSAVASTAATSTMIGSVA